MHQINAKIMFISLLLNLSLFSAQISSGSTELWSKFENLTINTMSPELSLEIMLYISANKDRHFINKLIENSSKEISIPIEWEGFLIKQIIDKNAAIVYGLDRIFDSNLYNYLSGKYATIFIQSNLLFSFILNMNNWGQRSLSIVLRPDNYVQIEQTLMKAVMLMVMHRQKNLAEKSAREKIGFFLAHSAVNLSSPSLAVIDMALLAAQGAPQNKMWIAASEVSFYQALNGILQAEMALCHGLPANSILHLAQRKAQQVASKGQQMLIKMAADKVLKTVNKLDKKYDRAEASYKLANLYILALMVEYVYVGTYMTESAKLATEILSNMDEDALQKTYEHLKELLGELSEDEAKNPMIAPLVEKLSAS